MKARVNNTSKALIMLLLNDPKIAEKVYENAKDKEKYKICTVHDNGNVVMGKTSIAWWNQLINCQDVLPFESFALRVWDALVDLSSGLPNKAIRKGLSQDIIEDSIRKKNYDDVVARLWDVANHVCQNGMFSRVSQSSEEDTVNTKEIIVEKAPRQPNIILQIGDNRKVIPFTDSIGDPLIDLEIGITDVKCRHGF